MAVVEIPAIVKEGFSLSVTHEQEVRLTIAGNADMDAYPFLGTFLGQLHEQVGTAGLLLVEVDFRKLYFMNSSCFKSIITWIASIKKPGSTPPYVVRFLANPNLHWQKRNLEAVQEFAPSIVEVVTR